MRFWVGPIHCPPSSTGVPSRVTPPSVRPPTRSRASTTTTSAPPSTRAWAAASPASPAPTTTTRLIGPSRPAPVDNPAARSCPAQ